MLRKLKQTFRQLRDGRPGRRFLAHYERNQAEGGSRWKTAGYVIAGLLLMAGGLLLSLPPGVPGFLLWIPGLGLLVARFRVLAVTLDRIEMLGRRLISWFRTQAGLATGRR